MAQLLAARSDLVVHGADESLLALVDIWNWANLSAETATQIRRDLIADGHASQWARFFLIVSQDAGYLWKQDPTRQSENEPPTVDFPMTPVIARYLPSFADGRRLNRSQMTLALLQWLWDMANGFANRVEVSEAVIQQGTDFVELMRGARVKTDDDN
jgi:hypothetical protein